MPQFCGVSGFRYTGLSVSPQDWGENDFQASRKLTGNQNPPRSAAVNQCYLGLRRNRLTNASDQRRTCRSSDMSVDR